MIGLLCFVLAILASPFKSKLRLEAENAVLRHQLIVLKRRLHGRVRGCGSPGGTSFTSNPFGPMGERPSGPFGGMMVESTPECTLRIDYDGGSRDMKEALAAAFKFLQAETS